MFTMMTAMKKAAKSKAKGEARAIVAACGV